MTLNNLFVVILLAASSSALGMIQTAGQAEAKSEKAKTKEEATSSFMVSWRLKEENRIRSTYAHFLYDVKKFNEERVTKSKVLQTFDIAVVIDMGFVRQVKILGQAVLAATSTDKKALAEHRMGTIITFAKYLFGLEYYEEEQLASICKIMNPWLILGGGEGALPARQLDDMWRELHKKELFSKEEAELMADAFTGWRTTDGK